MQLIGRIFAGILGVPVLLAGCFGLASAYFPGTDALQAVYAFLQGVNERLIETGLDIPIDASVTLEALLASMALRFVVAPIGCVLLVVAAGVPITTGKSEKSDSDESKSEAEDELPSDKRTQKKLRKAAAALKKKGDIEEAAELLWSGNELDLAAAYFIEAGMPAKAAAIRHDQNRFIESAEFYLESGDTEAAGAIFAQQEEFVRAGDCYFEADSLSVAAEMYDRGGEHRKAAQCYQKVEFHRHAAAAFVKVKAWLEAAECLELVYKDEAPKARNDSGKQQEIQKIARQAGQLFKRAQQPIRAKEILELGECWEDAANMAMHLERYAEAGELFRNAGQLEKAADALRQLGETEAAARILGEYHRDRGELAEAATQMEEAGDNSEAGDLYRQLERHVEAGTCYEKHGDFAAAAEMFRTAGERMSAARCYERIGGYAEAAECCALEGIPQQEASYLDLAGEYLRAGEVYHGQGMDDEAITTLQKVSPEDEGFSAASALLGDIFRARGQLSLAVKKLQQSIDGADLDRDNMPVYYTLATILEANGQYSESVDIYEKIMAFDYHYEDVERRIVETRQMVREQPPPVESTQEGGTGANSAVASSGQPGRYQVVGELGRGGMGIVYRAKDTVLDRVVAYKVLPDSFKENQQALANFIREAKAAAKLNHPNIVTVYDTGEQDGRYYIAMEFVDGTTLKEILRRRGVISPAGILHVLVQICEALAYAHEHKVVHRDIKPANAMWTRDKKVKIMDFGLAKVVEEARNHTTVVAGTPYYMSPEQTLGKNVDRRTDIYSLGATIFEMATGSVPFKEGNIPYHHVHTPPPDMRTLRPELPAALAEIVNRCLAKDPGDRYQSTGEILDDVRASLGQGPGQTT